jgi:hypothetical protein
MSNARRRSQEFIPTRASVSRRQRFDGADKDDRGDTSDAQFHLLYVDLSPLGPDWSI